MLLTFFSKSLWHFEHPFCTVYFCPFLCRSCFVKALEVIVEIKPWFLFRLQVPWDRYDIFPCTAVQHTQAGTLPHTPPHVTLSHIEWGVVTVRPWLPCENDWALTIIQRKGGTRLWAKHHDPLASDAVIATSTEIWSQLKKNERLREFPPGFRVKSQYHSSSHQKFPFFPVSTLPLPPAPCNRTSFFPPWSH